MNEALQNLEVTDKERAVLAALINGLYAEEGFSDVSADDLAKATELDIHAVGGVITSLQTKGFIWIDDEHQITNCPPLVMLSENHYDLHPNWEVY